jgi:aspartate carbamoyltransferase regulatory subunit
VTDSNWRDALSIAQRQRVEARLVCPNQGCHQQNKAGASPLIMIDERGVAVCDKCGHQWLPKMED